MLKNALVPPLILASLLALSTCDMGQTQPAICGDGVVDVSEQCDDGNRDDGDGCNSTCGEEPVAPECTTLMQSTDFSEVLSVLVTDNGRVLVVGNTEGSDFIWRHWVTSFDTEGQQQWKLDFAGPLSAVRPVDGNYAFIHHNDEAQTSDVVTLDEAGNATTLRSLPLPQDDPEIGTPWDLVDTDDGLLLGGIRQSDLWLAKLGDDGSLTTLVSRDHAGYRDDFYELRRDGTTIMALALVGVANHSDGDMIEFDTRDTWLIEYDQQGKELRQTVLSSGDDEITLAGNDIGVGPDGTRYVAGVKTGVSGLGLGVLGWGAAVRDGEVLWTFESPGSVDPNGSPFAAYYGLAVGAEHVMFAGHVGSTDGGRHWAMQLDAKTGELVAEEIGEPVVGGHDNYMDADGTIDGRAWLVGNVHTPDASEQRLCNVQL